MVNGLSEIAGRRQRVDNQCAPVSSLASAKLGRFPMAGVFYTENSCAPAPGRAMDCLCGMAANCMIGT